MGKANHYTTRLHYYTVEILTWRVHLVSTASLIERIERDRSLLASKNLVFLQVLLEGYRYVASALGSTFDPGWDDHDFVSWLERKLGASSIGARRSFSLVSLVVYDEREALDRFFELLAEYRRWKGHNATPGSAPTGVSHSSAAAALTYRTALSEVYARPQLYLGARSISRLRAWLDGFTLAVTDHHIGPVDEPAFRSLIASIHELRPTPVPCAWDKALLFGGDDESSALSTFFDMCFQSELVLKHSSEIVPG